MTIKLSQERKEDIVLMDPYFSQKTQCRKVGICVNTWMKIRREIGLPDKPKGRPKSLTAFKGEQVYPQAVMEAVERIREEVAKQKEEQRLAKLAKLEAVRKANLEKSQTETVESVEITQETKVESQEPVSV